jgi:outer membrane lipoprotein-sorting protein
MKHQHAPEANDRGLAQQYAWHRPWNDPMHLVRILGTAALLMLVGSAFAEDTPLPGAERGLEIAMEMDRRDTGWGDSSVTLTMILRNQHGDESVRSLRNLAMEMEGDGDRSMTIFDEPADVRGTSLLTFSHATDPDDQWLFLPALGRVKRIASNNKSGPFMGSEFAFEDMSSQEVDKYTYNFLREEACGDMTCFVVERFPVDRRSGYTRQIAWVDTEHYRAIQVEFYDRRGDLMKTLSTDDWELYLDQYWRAGRLEMVNHQTGKSTELLFEDFVFDNGYTERDFSQNALRNAR